MIAGPALKLVLAETQLAALRDAARVAYPKEFCGLLIGAERPDNDDAGTVAQVTRIVFADNLDPHPERGFELDPRVLIRELRALREAERAGRGRGERLLGHVHSHPDAPAIPSARDLSQAIETGQIWLIVPVRKGRAGAPRAFQALTGVAGQTKFRPVRLASS